VPGGLDRRWDAVPPESNTSSQVQAGMTAVQKKTSKIRNMLRTPTLSLDIKTQKHILCIKNLEMSILKDLQFPACQVAWHNSWQENDGT